MCPRHLRLTIPAAKECPVTPCSLRSALSKIIRQDRESHFNEFRIKGRCKRIRRAKNNKQRKESKYESGKQNPDYGAGRLRLILGRKEASGAFPEKAAPQDPTLIEGAQ